MCSQELRPTMRVSYLIGQSEIGQLSLKLKQAIDSFVENPVFEKFGVIDAQLSAKAGRDLEQIITTSTQLKKSSEWLERVRR